MMDTKKTDFQINSTKVFQQSDSLQKSLCFLTKQKQIY